MQTTFEAETSQELADGTPRDRCLFESASSPNLSTVTIVTVTTRRRRGVFGILRRRYSLYENDVITT